VIAVAGNALTCLSGRSERPREVQAGEQGSAHAPGCEENLGQGHVYASRQSGPCDRAKQDQQPGRKQ